MKYQSASYRIAKVFIVLFLAMMGILSILPFLHVIALSLSGYEVTEAGYVGLLPMDMDTQAWERVLNDTKLWRTITTSLLRIVLGVGLTLIVSVPAAYVLALDKRAFPFRKFYVGFMLVPMFIGGGLIPGYILMKRIGLINSIWALVIPSAASMAVMILLLNFFRRIPKDIREAAEIDGANDIQMLRYMYIPLGMPCIITIAMFSAINHWNAWFDGVIYMQDVSLYPMQTYIYSVLASLKSMNIGQQNITEAVTVSRESVKAAYTVFSIIPIAMVYPLLQRYVKDGLVLGSVKG